MDKHFANWKLRVLGETEDIEVRSASDGIRWSFVAICKGKNGDPDIKVTDTDIEKLRKMMQKRLEENWKLEWKNMLLIEIDADFRDVGKEVENDVSGTIMPWEAKLEFHITRVQISKDRKGEPCQRRGPGQFVERGWPEVGPVKKKGWHDKDQKCLIDDTPENREVLRLIFAGMKDIQKKLCTAFDPKRVEKTLEIAMSKQKALPFKPS